MMTRKCDPVPRRVEQRMSPTQSKTGDFEDCDVLFFFFSLANTITKRGLQIQLRGVWCTKEGRDG